MLRRPQDAENEGRWNGMQPRFEPRKRKSSPPRFLEERPAEQRRVVEDRQRQEDSPVERAWIGESESWQDDTRENNEDDSRTYATAKKTSS